MTSTNLSAFRFFPFSSFKAVVLKENQKLYYSKFEAHEFPATNFGSHFVWFSSQRKPPHQLRICIMKLIHCSYYKIMNSNRKLLNHELVFYSSEKDAFGVPKLEYKNRKKNH